MHPLHAAFASELVKIGARAARSTLTSSSSNVKGFRYDPSAKELFITYKSGGTYRYDDVPAKAARALARAKSVGKAVNKHVKGAGYLYEKVSREHERIHVGHAGHAHAHPLPALHNGTFHRMVTDLAKDQLVDLVQLLAERLDKEAMPIEAGGIVDTFHRRGREIQKLAGAAKSQVTWQGLTMKIEHEPGDVRTGTSRDGKKWERPMVDAAYGYVAGTGGKGEDGEAIDVYFSEHPVDGPVYRIKQLKKDTTDLDEYKYMVGYPSADEAKKAYLQHMPPWAFGGVDQVGKTFDDFKNFVRE